MSNLTTNHSSGVGGVSDGGGSLLLSSVDDQSNSSNNNKSNNNNNSMLFTNNNNKDYNISPLTTQDDNGKPTSSLVKDINRVLALVEDEKQLMAYKLYTNIKERIDSYEKQQRNNNNSDGTIEKKENRNLLSIKQRRKNQQLKEEETQRKEAVEHDYKTALEIINENQTTLERLIIRAKLFLNSKEDLTSDTNWILVQKWLGITTYYKREDDKSLSIKLEGNLDGSLFEQVAVLREVDLHCKWVPFCTSSLIIKELNKLDVVGWFVTGLPMFGLMRDGCFRAVSCDNLEDGKILLVGHGVADDDNIIGGNNNNDSSNNDDENNEISSISSIQNFLSNDPVIESLDIPPVPTKMGSGRMTIRRFDAVIDVLSPTTIETRVIANVNPNLTIIPQSLIEFVMKKLCGLLLCKLQGAAQRIIDNPVSNVHARRIRDDYQFYKNWLLPKFQYHCTSQGWVMPSIPALQLTDEQKQQDLILRERDYQKEQQKRQSKRQRMKRSVTYANDDDFHYYNPNEATSRSTRMHSSDDVMMQHQDHQLGNTSFDNETTHTDMISELSTTSSSSSGRSKNPMVRILRDIEMRTQMKKEQKISEARQRASSRLKAKPFASSDINRINELKESMKQRQRSQQQQQQEEDGKSPIVIVGEREFPPPPPMTMVNDNTPIISNKTIVDITTNSTAASNKYNNNRSIKGRGPLNDIIEESIVSNGGYSSTSATPSSFNVQPSENKRTTASLSSLPLSSSPESSHDEKTRFVIQVTLIVLMFATLSSSVLVDPFLFPTTSADTTDDRWYVLILRDIGTITYLLVCAMIHFLLIDTALIDAYDTLELGMKTGTLTKSYYNTSKRVFVAIMSFGIITMCAGRAIISSFFTIGVEFAIRAYQYIFIDDKQIISTIMNEVQSRTSTITSLLSPVVVSFVESGLSWLMSLYDMVIYFTTYIISHMVNSICWLTIRSNFIGRAIESGISRFTSFLYSFFVEDIVKAANNEKEWYDTETTSTTSLSSSSWRSNAIISSRLYLSYSAVFFITILVLFKVGTKHEKTKSSIPHDDEVVNSTNNHDGEERQQQNGYVPLQLTTNGGRRSVAVQDSKDDGSKSSSSTGRRRFGQRIKNISIRRRRKVEEG